MINRRDTLKLAAGAAVATTLAARNSWAQDSMPGVTDTEIKIGNIAPFSGAGSAFSVCSLAEAAYFKMINDQGGINGRKINFISYDDGYSPPKAVEQARKLVEQDQVAFIFQSLGTASNAAIESYMNAKKVPQLLVGSGATRFANPSKSPWTMVWPPSYLSEGVIYGEYVKREMAGAKVAILYQNDDFGRDIAAGFKQAAGDSVTIVGEASYEASDPTVDSQILALKASGATVLLDAGIPKFAAQAIRQAAEIGWNPTHIVTTVANSVASVMEPAGLDNSTGVLSAAYMMDPTDPTWADHPAMKKWEDFMAKYYPKGDRTNSLIVYGYLAAQLMVVILKQCGNDLSRARIMKEAANLKDVELEGLLPGIKVNTSPTDYVPVEQMQMMRFNGTRWELFGDLLGK